MLIVLYIAFIYVREKAAYRIKRKEWLFELLLAAGVCSIAFDGITAYTVNYLEQVPDMGNRILHACFLCSLDTMVFLMFLYILDITGGIPKRRGIRLLLELPFFISVAVVILFIPDLSYCRGGDYQLLHGSIGVYLLYYGCRLYVGNRSGAFIRMEKDGAPQADYDCNLCSGFHRGNIVPDGSSAGIVILPGADFCGSWHVSEYGKSGADQAAYIQSGDGDGICNTGGKP